MGQRLLTAWSPWRRRWRRPGTGLIQCGLTSRSISRRVCCHEKRFSAVNDRYDRVANRSHRSASQIRARRAVKPATMAGSCHAASSSPYWFTAFRIEVIGITRNQTNIGIEGLGRFSKWSSRVQEMTTERPSQSCEELRRARAERESGHLFSAWRTWFKGTVGLWEFCGTRSCSVVLRRDNRNGRPAAGLIKYQRKQRTKISLDRSYVLSVGSGSNL